MQDNQENWYSEYELRQFIDMATRWGLQGVLKDRKPARPYSVFTEFVNNAKGNYDKFSIQLRDKLSETSNWKALEIDLNDRFLLMINQYLRWYVENEKEIDKFKPYCPYTFMRSIIESTKKEIVKYFPEKNVKYLPKEIKDDIKYSLETLWDETAQKTHHYRSYKYQIKNNGAFIIKDNNKDINIYTPELSYILISQELRVYDCKNQRETKIRGRDYLNTYISGYIQGKKYFKKEFAISTNSLIGGNTREYIRDLHYNYFHVNNIEMVSGWQFVRNSSPLTLTHKQIEKFGFYSGVVSKVDDLLKKFPELFATFDKCDHDVPPKQEKNNESKTNENLTIHQKVENYFSFMLNNDPRKHQLILSKNDFDNLINWVTYYFENNFELPDITQPIQNVNTNKGNVIYTFMSFFKKEHPSRTRPESLYELIKACFYEYRDDNITNFKKQKKPQYYDDLISKNK